MSAPEQDNPAEAPARIDAPRRTGVLGRRTVGEVVAHAMDELEVRREYGVTGWATGIASLDGRIRQVMAPGRVVCIAGGTKSGKTALAGQIVVALAAQDAAGRDITPGGEIAYVQAVAASKRSAWLAGAVA